MIVSIVLGGVFGFISGVFTFAVTGHPIWMLLSFSGLGLAVPEILIPTIFFHIENR